VLLWSHAAQEVVPGGLLADGPMAGGARLSRAVGGGAGCMPVGQGLIRAWRDAGWLGLQETGPAPWQVDGAFLVLRSSWGAV
jgi:hypothetical protein